LPGANDKVFEQWRSFPYTLVMQATTKPLNPVTETRGSVRRAAGRGSPEHGWLHARFIFSFASYFDPDHMGFKSLRVMNNDTIEPGGGFPDHPHQDMEIFTYIIDGEVTAFGETLAAGDGIAVENASEGFEILVNADSKFLLFRLA
jgi:hypothetical protein